MREIQIGDFVETIHGINGILVDVRKGRHGLTAFVATFEGATFYCPINDLKECRYKEEAD